MTTQKNLPLHHAWHHLLLSNPNADVVLAFWEGQADKELNWFWRPAKRNGHGTPPSLLDAFWMAVHSPYAGPKDPSIKTWDAMWKHIEPRLNLSQDVAEEIVENLIELPPSEGLIKFVVDRLPERVWSEVSEKKKKTLCHEALVKDHVPLVSRILESGQTPNFNVECAQNSRSRGDAVEGPLLADVCSAKMAECLLQHGANPNAAMSDGTSVLSFLKGKDAKLFAGERERKGAWSAVEAAVHAISNDPEQKKRTCLDGIAAAKQPAELRFALKKLDRDEWRAWKMSGGGTLIHFLAFTQPMLFDVAIRALKASDDDLRVKDNQGADPYAYFLCAGADRPHWKEKEVEEWERGLAAFARVKANVNLTTPEGLREFSNQALHVLESMPELKSESNHLAWAKSEQVTVRVLKESAAIREGRTIKEDPSDKLAERQKDRELLKAWKDACRAELSQWAFELEDRWRAVSLRHGKSAWRLSGWFVEETVLENPQSRELLSSESQLVVRERQQLHALQSWASAVKSREYTSDKKRSESAESNARSAWTQAAEGITKSRWEKLKTLIESDEGSSRLPKEVWTEAKNLAERQLLLARTESRSNKTATLQAL